MVRATQRVSFEVDPADRFVLLGPSGCGKSTLLKAVAGFITPSEGEIRLQGQAVRRPAPTVSWCSRSSASCRHGRPYGRTCCFPLRVSGQVARDEAERRADECSRRSAWRASPRPTRTRCPGHEGAGGDRPALAMQPKILLMDELFAALDALTRRKMQEELLRLWEEVRFTPAVRHPFHRGRRWWWATASCCCRRTRAVRAEVHGHPFGLYSLGGEALQAAARRSTACCSTRAAEPTAAETLDFADIRLAH